VNAEREGAMIDEKWEKDHDGIIFLGVFWIQN
jgi:hypothetical protein